MGAVHIPQYVSGKDVQVNCIIEAAGDYAHLPASIRQSQISHIHSISQNKDFAVQQFLVEWNLRRNVSLYIQLYDSFCKERKAERLFPHHDFW